MDGFFDKYGRVIIIAVAICFVLLFLTPMRNVVGSSINGFAGNFANKVGESLGTVKMPDGSDNVAKEKSSMLINGYAFHYKIPSEATSVIFTDEKAPNGTPTTDLTVAKDGDVVGYLDGATWKVSTQDSNKLVNFNEDCSWMFDRCGKLTNISFNNVDTSNVKNIDSMFEDCSNLTSLDLSGFNISNVTSMGWMFRDCSNLKSLDVRDWDTSKVVNMISMFSGCPNLTSLDLSSFNTSNVTSIGGMFYGCSNLQKVKARSWTDINKFKAKNASVSSNVKFEVA